MEVCLDLQKKAFAFTQLFISKNLLRMLSPSPSYPPFFVATFIKYALKEGFTVHTCMAYTAMMKNLVKYIATNQSRRLKTEEQSRADLVGHGSSEKRLE